MALGLAVYGLSAEREAILIADAFLLGAAGTAVSTVAPVFVISAGLTPDLEARRLTALNVCQPIGQTGLAAVLAIAATAGLSFSGRFYLAGGILFVLALVVWLTSAGPARQIRASAAAPEPSSTLPTPKRRKTLTPDFTRFLAIVFLTSVAFVGVVNQISNILPKVYGFSESQTATVVSVAGFAAIFFFFVAGRTLRRTNAVRTTATGVIVRLVATLGLALAGALFESPALLVGLLAALLVQLLYVTNSYTDLAMYPLGIRLASIPASEASGWVFGTIAVAGAAGSILGGVLAGEFGYNAINWMAATAAAGAVLLLAATTRRGAQATAS